MIAAYAGVDVVMFSCFFDGKKGLLAAAALTGTEHPLPQLTTLLDAGNEKWARRWCVGSCSCETETPPSNHY